MTPARVSEEVTAKKETMNETEPSKRGKHHLTWVGLSGSMALVPLVHIREKPMKIKTRKHPKINII
jgi:hypothetical protein